MAEGGEDYFSDDDSDVSLSLDSDNEETSNNDDFEDELQFEYGDGKVNKENETFEERKPDTELSDKEAEGQVETGDRTEEKGQKRPLNIPKWMDFVSGFFYGQVVAPLHINILTDFVDAEIFMIDGDSLLFELLGERSLDWSNGGQFLHLTYLLERFLQYFTDKGGVFHIVFFKDMEILWNSQPSMLLARQSLILHLKYNTNFTVVSSIDNFWGEQWKEYVNDKIPAFLLLTDAENIPFETTKKEQQGLEFFFRSFLFYSLGQGLNCVFISGIEMTATKVIGFYTQANSEHNKYLRKNVESVRKTWHVLTSHWRKETSENEKECSGDSSSSQIDVKERVKTAFKFPPAEGGCRKLATVLACEMILGKVMSKPNANRELMKATEDRIKLFLLHSLLLNKLPLKYRAQTINSNLLDRFCQGKDGHVYPFQEIHKCLWKILKVIQDDYPAMKDAASSSLDMTSVADIMDGRLVHALFSLALDQRSMDMEAFSLPEEVIKEVESAWSEIVAAVNTTQQSDLFQSHCLPIFAGSVTGVPSKEDGDNFEWETCVKLKKLLDVDNVLVNEYAGDIRLKVNNMAEEENEEEELFNIGREFDERYHWHSLKPLSDDYDRTKQAITEKPPDDPKQRKKHLIDKQKYVRFHRCYGDSLTGGVDRAKIIIVRETDAKKKKGKEKDGKRGGKAERIIEQNRQKRKEQEQERDQEKWTRNLAEIEKSLRKENYIAALQFVDKFLVDCKSPVLSFQALMKKAQSCMEAWQDIRSRDAKSNQMKYPVLLVECVRKILCEFNNHLTSKDKKKLAGYMQKLGFGDISAMFYELNPENENKARRLSVHTTSARFQLEFMGHLLKREERTDPDPRVDHFIPDSWQRALLDAVDNNESAVIVAPTSSGKTYASYYCMEKVLRESNEGVVVYVSPTKALVNQVAATIYAHFNRKQLPEGRSVYGVFTRDYRHNTLNSQILVTVPQCLEILFLSPRRQDWTKNIKYVIFDEVHCLGQEIGAEVWEHLLLLIRCPFLALSATIGNPRDLLQWLQAAQDFRQKQDEQDNGKLRKSYRVRLVTCEERYSDLEKSIYLPKCAPSDKRVSEETGKCEGNDGNNMEEFVSLHPCALQGVKQLRENGYPGDMALTPRETLQLYDAIAQHCPGNGSLKRLSPEKYFQGNTFIDKKHVRQYEEELKKELKSWADDDNQLKKVESVLQSLNNIGMEELATRSSDKDFIPRNFSTLVEKLKAQDKLPALVFSFDREMCRSLAMNLAREFEEKEEAIRAGTRKLDEKKRLQAEKDVKRTRDKADKEKAKSTREMLEEAQDEVSEFSNLNEPLPECTLSFVYGIGNQSLKKIMGRIWMVDSNDPFKRALKRGISYHHAGLDSKRRSVVEMLFREKYLQVVAATGTLALGIHMPCKTVVFAGDSPFLNSLMYRQMSGRAGRRGFDPVGNVVFFGVPYRKVQRLITANIPKLVGNFPINVSLVLRLLLMTSKGDDSRDALTKSLTLLSHSFICQKHREMEGQIKKHFLFSVELLARLSLINKNTGAPQEMAGLATHLHYHEPSNFVLISFLQGGLFHKLCKPGRNGKFSEDVMRKMVLVLSHLFGRVYLHANYKRRIHLCPTSKVILEDLPKKFVKALRSYNEQVTKVFRQYLTTVAAEHEGNRGEENKLPLSGIEFPNQKSINVIDKFGTIKNLGRFAIAYSACSSFAALSANSDLQLHSQNQTEEDGDDEEHQEGAVEESEGSEEDEDADSDSTDWETSGSSEKSEEEEGEFHREPIDQLLKISRQDVYTDMNVIPTLPVEKRNSTGRIRHLNAYALDFFKHGSTRAIEEENGIRSGEAFKALKDFYLTIKSISCSLEELGTESDNVVRAFGQLAEEFGKQFNKAYGRDT